jgi:hypothetical protein
MIRWKISCSGANHGYDEEFSRKPNARNFNDRRIPNED